MDSARFAKLCRESGLLGGRLTTTGVDLCFTKVKAKVRGGAGRQEAAAAGQLQRTRQTSRPSPGKARLCMRTESSAALYCCLRAPPIAPCCVLVELPWGCPAPPRRPQGGRKIGFKQFLEAVELLAKEKGASGGQGGPGVGWAGWTRAGQGSGSGKQRVQGRGTGCAQGQSKHPCVPSTPRHEPAPPLFNAEDVPALPARPRLAKSINSKKRERNKSSTLFILLFFPFHYFNNLHSCSLCRPVQWRRCATRWPPARAPCSTA